VSSFSPPEILLFDWDDTLADNWGAVTEALNAALAAFGLPLWDVSQTRASARHSLRESFPAYFGADWERARDIFYQTLERIHLETVKPKPGARALLEASRHLPRGVVSNKQGDLLRREVAHLGWAEHFGAVVGAQDAPRDKPDPAPFALALERLGASGIDPARVWYVGDTALDMEAARRAGFRAVLLGDAAHDGGIARAAPDLVFADGYALAAYLNSPP
jgi:phosphoglycolate phosphatase